MCVNAKRAPIAALQLSLSLGTSAASHRHEEYYGLKQGDKQDLRNGRCACCSLRPSELATTREPGNIFKIKYKVCYMTVGSFFVFRKSDRFAHSAGYRPFTELVLDEVNLGA